MRYADAITARKVPAPVETQADPFTLASLIAWLERQPLDTGYEFVDCHGKCLIGLYIASQGVPWNSPIEGAPSYTEICRKMFGVYPGGNIPIQSVASEHPMTFGAALARARKLVSGMCD